MHFPTSILLLGHLSASILANPVQHPTTRNLITIREDSGGHDDDNLNVPAGNSSSSSTSSPDSSRIPFDFDDDDDTIDTLTAAFTFLEDIPDDAGTWNTQHVHDWASAHKDDYFNHTADGHLTAKHRHSHDHKHQQSEIAERGTETSDLEARVDWARIAGCAAKLAQVVLIAEIPAARLLKLKSYIKALGGAYKVATALVKARTLAELYAISANWKLLVDILLGVSGVPAACGL